MKDKDITQWCRELFDGLKNNALWAVPRSGTVFQRQDDSLSWVASIPAEGDMSGREEFECTRAEFRKAGIPVTKNALIIEFNNFEEAKHQFGVGGTETKHVGVVSDEMTMRICANCHTRKPDYMFNNKLPVCNDCSVHGPARDVLGNRGADMVSMFDNLNRGAKPHPSGIAQSLLSQPIRTQRATQHDDSVKRTLLNIAGYKSHAGPLAPPVNVTKEEVELPDDRPLIDLLHEATFDNDAAGLTYIKDKYALRMLLRKAHCFSLDTVTSALVADFSVAIATDLESARRMAIPPFPVTWIDIDNWARLKRMTELGFSLTPTASGSTEAGPPVDRVGWLIHPGDRGGFFASYCCITGSGATMAPMSWWWHAGSPNDLQHIGEHDAYVQHLTFGVVNINTGPTDAYPDVTPLHYSLDETKRDRKHINALMHEISGELRHIWGLLIALGAGQLGLQAKTSPQALPTRRPPTMKNGKPLLPLEHKVLHLHLAKKMTPAKVVVRMTTHHRHKWHEVRAHFRTLRNKDGTVRMRVPVKSHERGDERLGRIEKQYSVER